MLNASTNMFLFMTVYDIYDNITCVKWNATEFPIMPDPAMTTWARAGSCASVGMAI
jgi:hypothetical protein